MSAEQYGRRLLEEVQEEGLEQLLAEIRQRSCPQSKSRIGIPQLDNLLQAFRLPSQPADHPSWTSATGHRPGTENEAEHHDDQEAEPSHRHEAPSRQHNATRKPAVIELTSSQSASGKTTLLLYISALAALPRVNGGNESAVIYIDNDSRFSAIRLVQIIKHHLETHHGTSTNLTSESIRQIAHEALNHIYIFRPQSSTQLLSILESSPSFLLDKTRHSSIYRPLGLVVLDSATAFYWQDRFDRTMAQLDTPSVAARDHPSKTADIIARLKALQTRFECAVAFSTNNAPSRTITQTHTGPETTPLTPAPQGPSLSPWTMYATLTLSLTRAQVPQFAPQMSLEECLRDAEKRLEAVRNARFIATVEWRPGQSLERDRVMIAMGAGEGSGNHPGFAFKIDGSGIDIE
ncbi:DNA-repair protein XRCC2 [Exophiala viscosa]|uniref:DNA-repair protein XRCC2 n=1 Tax=Exophiala viscosa TaxID=2486360 RepID=UPI00219CFB44|nr:DNA-repair protein XRCC2 [Exophiala viscosa]